MAFVPAVGDHVLCPRKGPNEYRVISEDLQHFTIVDLDGSNPMQFYKPLCYLNRDLIFANRARKIERAQKIGRPKFRK